MPTITATTFWVKKVSDRPYLANERPLREMPTGQETEGLQVLTFEDYLTSLRPQDREILNVGIARLRQQAVDRIEQLYIPIIESGEIPEDTPEFRGLLERLEIRDLNMLKERLFYFMRHAGCIFDEDTEPLPMCYEADHLK